MNVPQVSILKILYTTDLSETGRHAFTYAASLSKCCGAKLTVMHVVDEQPELDHRLVGYIPKDLWQDIKSRHLEEAKETLLERQRDNSRIIGECVGQYCAEIQDASPDEGTINYDIVVKLGDPVQEVVKYATEQGYDMIVVGRHAYSGLHDAVHRGTVRSILNATAIAVFVVQIPE